MEKSKWLYLLLLLPTITEYFETGKWPTGPRSIATNIVVTCCIAVLVWFLRKEYLKVKHLSETDGLTGLKNRRSFEKDLVSKVIIAQRIQTSLILVFIDINDFKQVNDRFGHQVGDEILIKVGAFLQASIRCHVDTCYRIGGDEFAILLQSKNFQVSIENKIKKIIEIESNELLKSYGASLAVGVATLKRKESSKDFFIRADKLMYRDKGNENDLNIVKNALIEEKYHEMVDK